MGSVNHEVSRTVCRGPQDVSHAGIPEVAVVFVKRQVWTVYFILTKTSAR
jgi:hypothetical protein